MFLLLFLPHAKRASLLLEACAIWKRGLVTLRLVASSRVALFTRKSSRASLYVESAFCGPTTRASANRTHSPFCSSSGSIFPLHLDADAASTRPASPRSTVGLTCPRRGTATPTPPAHAQPQASSNSLHNSSFLELPQNCAFMFTQ